MSIKKGQNLGGIHGPEDIIRRLVRDGDCLVWRGYAAGGVTPFAHIAGRKSIAVRRALAEMLGRKITPRTRTLMEAGCHKLCCNPDHMSVVTVGTYMREMTRRGVLNGPVQVAKLRVVSAARSAKITMEIATSIRDRHAAGDRPDIMAAEHGISVSHVHRILRGEAWVLPADVANGSSVFAWRPAA